MNCCGIGNVENIMGEVEFLNEELFFLSWFVQIFMFVFKLNYDYNGFFEM